MSARRLAAALASASVLALTVVSPAVAGTIRYGVVESPLFTIKDNGNGIVKLTYNGCVTAGARQTIGFTMTTTVQNSAPAELKVLKEEGQDPSVSITPNPVNLVAGPVQNIPVTIAFTLPSANNGVTTFRFKLDPANGEGLGQGAGVMVRIPCVLAAAPSPNVLANQAPAPPPPVPGVVPPPSAPPVSVPTRGAFPSIGSSLAAPEAACISLPQTLRVRARRTTRLTVRVNANGQNIRHALVRVTLPGGKRIFRRTNDQGVVRLFVRPSRSGTLVIQSDVCFGAARVTVRRAPARHSAAARYTG
jgi:hypothetical protein